MKDALKRSLALLLAFGMAFSVSFTALAEDDAASAADSEPVIVEVKTEPETVTAAPAPADETPAEAPVESPAEPAEEKAEPAAETPVEEPAAETPAEEPAAETPVEEPAVETPAEEPAAEEPAEETPVEEPAEETPVEEPAEETPAEEPVDETPVEEPVDETPVEVFAGSVSAVLQNTGDIHDGDAITYQAEIRGNADLVTVHWQVETEDPDTHEKEWKDLATGTRFTLTANEENLARSYRVVLVDAEGNVCASDAVKLPAIVAEETVEEPVVEEPVVEEPVVEEPVVEEPVVEEPVVEEPVVEEPVVEDPVVEEPVVEEPVVEEPVVEEPVVEEPVVEEPVVEEPVVEEPVVEEPVVEEPVVEEPVVEEPVVEEPVVEEPVVEEPVVEEPVDEEPVVEEPVDEEPVEEEPAVDEEPTEEEATDEEGTEEGEIEVETADLAGDAILSDNVTTTINIPSGKDQNTAASGMFTMTAAGLLTITFKCINDSHGNLEVLLRSATDDDRQLWGITWSQDIGTVNFSDFVDIGEYKVIIRKADPTDEATYDIQVTPYVTRNNEVGSRNNTPTNAVNVPVDGKDHFGIYSIQDALLNKIDWYKFTLTSPGKLEVSVTNLTLNEMGMLLYGEDGLNSNIPYYGNALDPTSNINEDDSITYRHTDWFDAGTYYIIFESNESHTYGDLSGMPARGRYSIKLTLTPVALTEVEPNNTIDQADSSGNRLDVNNGTESTGMLSISSWPFGSGGLGYQDYYEFYLPMDTRVSFSGSIQFQDVDLEVYNQTTQLDLNLDDGTPVSFGETGTSGYEGNPYMMEKRTIRLPAGYHFLKVTNCGFDGLYSVKGQTLITASKLTTTYKDGVITAEGMSYGGKVPASAHYYLLKYWNTEITAEHPAATWDVVDMVQFDEKNGTAKFYPTKDGKYYVEYEVTDGLGAGTDHWDKNPVNEPDVTDPTDQRIIDVTLEPFAVKVIEVTNDGKGKLKLHAIYNPSKVPLDDSYYFIYRGSELIMSERLFGGVDYTYQCPINGTYSIMFSGFIEGYTNEWSNAWVVVDDVYVPSTLPLTIADVGITANNAGKTVKANVTITGGFGLKNIKYELIDDNTNTVIQTREQTNGTSWTFTNVPVGKYHVHVSAYDGHTWAYGDSESIQVHSATVTAIAAKPVSLKDDGAGQGNLTMTATVQSGTAITTSYFELYYSKDGSTWEGPEIVKTTADNRVSAKKTVYKSGKYQVHYVARNADGLWNTDNGDPTDGWSNVLDVTLLSNFDGIGIDIHTNTATTQSDGIIKVKAKITGSRTPTSVNYYLYYKGPTGSDPNWENAVIDFIETKDSSEVTFYVNTDGVYLIRAIAKDGYSTDQDEVQVVYVTAPVGPIVDFKVEKVYEPVVDMYTVTFNADTTDSRALVYGYFVIHKDNQPYQYLEAKNRTAKTTLQAGEYTVQYTCYDGGENGWTAMWYETDSNVKTFKVGTSSSSSSGGSAVKANRDGYEYIDCSITVSSTNPIQWAGYKLYEGTKLVAQWVWPGSGSYLKHSFRAEGLGSPDMALYEYYDGVEWKNAWIPIT